MTQAGILLHQPSQGKNRNFCTGRFQLSRVRQVGDGTPASRVGKEESGIGNPNFLISGHFLERWMMLSVARTSPPA
jgi:hypothetical protein